jgi:hypothetical protein
MAKRRERKFRYNAPAKRKRRRLSYVSTNSAKQNTDSYYVKTDTGEILGANPVLRQANWVNAVNGFRVPRFKRLIARNQNASSAYVRTRTAVYSLQPRVVTVGHLAFDPVYRNRRYVYEGFGNSGSGWTIPYQDVYQYGPIPADLLAQATHKLYAGMRSKLHSINTAEDLAQVSQFMNQIRNPADSLFRTSLAAIDSWKLRVSRVPIKRLVKTLADTHLEWQFGAKPSLDSIAKAFIDLTAGAAITATKTVVPLRTRNGHPWVKSKGDVGLVQRWITSNFQQEIAHCSQKSRSYRVQYDYKIQTESMFPTALKYGLHFNNSIITAYNCVPWSWLVDYFTNLDDVIEGLSFPWSRVVYCTRTTYQEGQRKSWLDGNGIDGGTLLSETVQPGYWDVRSIRAERVVITTPPRLPVVFHHRRLSGVNKLNMAAALFQKVNPLLRVLNNIPILKLVNTRIA